jgi:hypothetical protein
MSASFGIVGNCTARGFARSLELLVPGSRAFVFHLGKIATEPSEVRKAGWLKSLAEADIVFSLPLSGGTYGDFEPDKLEKICQKVVRFPYIAFTGYQPDCIYIRKEGRDIQGPMGPYHSALVAGAFLEGLSAARTARLFNNYVFASLGYFDQFEKAAVALQRSATQLGYDIGPMLHGDVFMHTVNHPTISAIHAVAIQALDLAGIRFDRDLIPNAPDDELRGAARWPIYPGIAQALSKPGGSYEFFHAVLGKKNLHEFVVASHEAFAAVEGGFTAPALDRARRFLQAELVQAV